MGLFKEHRFPTELKKRNLRKNKFYNAGYVISLNGKFSRVHQFINLDKRNLIGVAFKKKSCCNLKAIQIRFVSSITGIV